MRPRTRARFIALQQAIRPAATFAAIAGEWTAKSARQRSTWVNALTQTEHAQAQIDGLLDGPGGLHETIRRIDDMVDPNAPAMDTPDQWKQWIVSVRDTIDRLEDIRDTVQDHYDALEAAWINMWTVENGHRGRADDSLRYDIAQVTFARDNIDWADQERDRMRDLLRNLPVPVVAGVKRAPVFLAGEDHLRDEQERQHRHDLENHRLGHPVLDHLGRWVPHRGLGGGQGVSWLWLRFDGNNRLTDRVVRKEVFQTDTEWNDPRGWWGDLRDPDVKRPFEIECHEALSEPDTGVVRLRCRWNRCMLDNDQQTFRYYTQWAPFGDLDSVIKHYLGTGEHIPEPFLWYVAQELALAGRSMADGTGTGNNLDWAEIVHRDLKPANVFLDDNNQNDFPHYPRPMVGDFGCAFRTPQNDKNNPRWWQEIGDRYFMAPEVHQWVDLLTRKPTGEKPIREKTNVFGLGMIVWCLMTRTPDPPETLWLTAQPYGFTPAVTAQYTEELRGLVIRCMRYDPDGRPSFDAIETEITQCVDVSNVADGMESTTVAQEVADQYRLLDEVRDAYRLGLARDQLP